MHDSLDLARNLALLALSLLLAGLAGEFVLRHLGYYGIRTGEVVRAIPVDDPILDFRRVPGESWIHNNIHYSINQHGWRDYDYDYEKPPGTFRIVVLGDSVTNGHKLEVEEIYAKRLEQRLNGNTGAKSRFQVILLSIGALNTEQEVHLLEIEGLKYDPDLVLVGYVLNDPSRNASLRRQRERKRNATLWEKLKGTAKQSSLLHLTYRSSQKMLWRLRQTLGREGVADYVQDDYFTHLHRNQASWNRVVKAFKKLGDLTRSRGIPVAVVIFPVLHELEDYSWTEIHQQVGDAARSEGFAVLDLLPTLSSYPASSLQVVEGDHIHPSSLGHRLAGEAVFDFLQERELLPPVQ